MKSRESFGGALSRKGRGGLDRPSAMEGTDWSWGFEGTGLAFERR